MTSSMMSQGGLKVGPLYSFINEITFFMITKQRAKISSLNFLCICIMRLWLQLYKYISMTLLMTPAGHKIGQILKLIYLRQCFNYSVDQKLKMSEMLMAIFLVYSTSGITSGKKSLSRAQNGGHFENFEILCTASIWPQIWKDRPKLCKKTIFMMMTSSMTSQDGLKVGPLYSFIYKWNNNIFHDNSKTSKDIIIKLPVHMYHDIMTTIICIYIHDIIDDVTGTQNISNFEIDIYPSIFELQRRSKAQNVRNAHGYLSGIFNFRYYFR